MNETTITCIVCPVGCKLLVCEEGGGLDITGNKCNRGIGYAEEEVRNPVRTLTSTVLVKESDWRLVSVRTAAPIPKGSIFRVMDEIRGACISAPVSRGQVIVENAAGTGVDVIATKTVKRSS